RAVKKAISIPLIVGGGIRNKKDAKKAVKAGADIIVTGTAIENNFQRMKEIINSIKKK
ncbi:MAG TPA: geranylgeranylglyceryl/heptaprenylglyceryl phosphate synthase, partial [archaeon]|nr:geranylgeranylglyceryl/heptaprenylglyceryl phosphate synthase [archaeon]